MPLRFHDEHNVMVEDREGESEMVRSMLSLDGWILVGWTYAEQIISGGVPFSYLCMFEQDGTKVWCQISEPNFFRLAEQYLQQLSADTA